MVVLIREPGASPSPEGPQRALQRAKNGAPAIATAAEALRIVDCYRRPKTPEPGPRLQQPTSPDLSTLETRQITESNLSKPGRLHIV